MIGKLKLWTSDIIIAVVISIIIEMIIPDGNNKKYVKVVSGLYILFVILNPFLDVKNKLNLNEIKNTVIRQGVISTSSQINVAETYILSLENALKAQIDELGYSVDYIQFYLTQDYGSIVRIDVKMKNGTTYETEKIKDLVLQSYNLNRESIVVN